MSGVLNAFWGSAFSSASAAFTAIATVTAAGGETSLTFSSIPATYTDLQIRGVCRDTYTGAGTLNLRCYFNTINTPSSTSYASHQLFGDGTAVTATGESVTNDFMIKSSSGGSNDAANMFGASIIDISDYASTTKNKTVRAISGYETNAATTDKMVALSSGLWVSTAAITSINIKANAIAFKAGSTFTLYGIKGAA